MLAGLTHFLNLSEDFLYPGYSLINGLSPRTAVPKSTLNNKVGTDKLFKESAW